MQPQDLDDLPKQKNKPKNRNRWRALPATPQRLATMFREQKLPKSGWQRAQQVAGYTPTKDDWTRFIDILLSGMGTIFLLAGILFFFAFNWDDLSKWHRFAIVEGAVVISTALVFVFNIDKWAGRLALGTSAILLGVALAVISQEYQTGADSYRLFQIWLMMITGWVLISRWNIMYLMWLILLNLTITLYWDQVIVGDWQTLNLIMLSINLGFVVVWEIVARATAWQFMVEGRWFLYIVMAIAVTHGTYMMCDYILEAQIIWTILQPISYAMMLLLTLAVYVGLKRDLLMIAFASLSVLIVSIVFIGYNLGNVVGYDSFGSWIVYFLIMAVVTIGLTAFLGTGLRQLHQRWEVNNE